MILDERLENGFLSVRRTFNALIFDDQFHMYALGIAGRTKIKFQGWHASGSLYIMCFEKNTYYYSL